MEYSRIKRGSKSLPEKGDHSVDTGQVCAKSSAESEKTSEERNGREEEGDDEEHPEESGHEVVLVLSASS